ncbi:uncharacterized protein LOC121855577 [Homarus americanus]|uniref:Cyclic GMP-AMP synthase n=1 Tax=Homarus americanus TaxID=6706 RepID=A0A8J5JA45_HOMAM|nr:uncharacterized protein LOC121855577 [Homarus americanus]XP_042206523.1 uncharacterized protein LOC121855577 [Homarus americanus]XP_042206524.1 uncharacterized protein LOC121855577 [Homarus americanus]XP_042206525.1 uncharacterized protein LOC121855577 [Homarus americanus]XP_042206526.1 uncharacterized protein LOC121855577 [Homarus americanus]KAG7155087.1 hypothetical protein Hamer_G015694 [Homarus americanus]
MARRNEDVVVRSVLGRLNKVSFAVNQNKELVNKLVTELGHCLQREEGTLKGSTIRHAGSAYENLAVKNQADYDLILQLGEPFVSNNFTIIQDSHERFMLYTLQRRENPLIRNKDIFCSKRGNLKTEELRNDIFERLKKILSTIKVPGMTLKAYPKLAAMQLILTTGNREPIEMDLTPQIVACEWKNCPGLVSLESLPRCLVVYVESNSRRNAPVLYFTPAVLSAQKNEAHEVCNMVSFSLLEKHFLKEEVNIHDMVRLAKLVKDQQNWTNDYGLKSFHLKRLAIKNADTLRTMTTWNGFKALLQFLDVELEEKGGITDCFVNGNFIYYITKPNKVKGFCHALRDVQRWQPDRLNSMV